MNADSISSETLTIAAPSRGRRLLSGLAWTSFAVLALVFFTVLKLPQNKIHAYVTGFISGQLAPMGIQFSAESGGLELGLGLFYEMRNVTLTRLQTNKTMKISRIEARPAALALLQGKLGAHLALEEGQGQLQGTVLMSGDDTEITFNASNLNLGLMGALPFLAGIEGTAEISGEGEVLGNLATPSSLSGNIKIGLSRVVLDQQTIMGMVPLPKTTISDGIIDITLGGGRALFNQFRLGREGGNDVFLSLSGDIRLGRSVESSEANLRAKASLPESLKQTIPSFLTQKFRKPDGSLAFRLNGPLSGMFPSPET